MKKWILLGLSLLLTSGLVGCSGAKTAKSETETSSMSAKTTESEMAKPETETSASTEMSQTPTGVKIVVATNNASDGRDVWLQQHAQEAGFNIEIVAIGGADLAARVISEVNNPTINVVWGPSEDQFTSMIAAGALTKYTPVWASEVAGVSKENGYSWSYEIQPKIFVCNPKMYTQDTAPKTISDLWEKQEFHGKYKVADNFSGSSDRAIIGSILGQYLDPKGELGVSDEGWKAIKAYYDNGYKMPAGENDFENMASGKVPITYIFASGLSSKSASFNIQPLILYFKEGQPTNTNQIGIVANKDPKLVEESMRFADWLGSADVIGAYAQANGNMVANKDAEDKMIPITKEIKEKYKPMDLDWTYINSMMDQWIAKIQLDIYK